jgi:hypothetical protein
MHPCIKKSQVPAFPSQKIHTQMVVCRIGVNPYRRFSPDRCPYSGNESTGSEVGYGSVGQELVFELHDGGDASFQVEVQPWDKVPVDDGMLLLTSDGGCGGTGDLSYIAEEVELCHEAMAPTRNGDICFYVRHKGLVHWQLMCCGRGDAVVGAGNDQ